MRNRFWPVAKAKRHSLYSMHNELHKILSTKNDGDIYQNKTENELSISNLSNDSLSYIFSFCNDKEVCAIKRTCRLFTVISRKAPSNDIGFDPINYEKNEPSLKHGIHCRCHIIGQE